MDGVMNSFIELGKRAELSPLAYIIGEQCFGLNLMPEEPKLKLLKIQTIEDLDQDEKENFDNSQMTALETRTSFKSEEDIEEETKTKSYSDSQVKLPPESPMPPSTPRDLKVLFRQICLEDTLSLSLLSSLSEPHQRVATELLKKRYKEGLLDAKNIQHTQGTIDLRPYLISKRSDHSQKMGMSIRLSVLKAALKAEVLSSSLYDKPQICSQSSLSQYLRKKYYHPVLLRKLEDSSEKHIYTLLFDLKKGLTKKWFSGLSSKFLADVLKVGMTEMKENYFGKLAIKLEEIFGEHFCSTETSYLPYMLDKIQCSKFKMPMSSYQIDLVQKEINEKVEHFYQIKRQKEIEEFSKIFGDEGLRVYQDWCEL